MDAKKVFIKVKGTVKFDGIFEKGDNFEKIRSEVCSEVIRVYNFAGGLISFSNKPTIKLLENGLYRIYVEEVELSHSMYISVWDNEDLMTNIVEKFHKEVPEIDVTEFTVTVEDVDDSGKTVEVMTEIDKILKNYFQIKE